MKLLIVDRTTEAQAAAAAVINKIDQSDWDLLDLNLQLANPDNYQMRLATSDVLILGPALGEEAKGLARTAKTACPDVEIIMLVSSAHYCAGTFRAVHGEEFVLPFNAVWQQRIKFNVKQERFLSLPLCSLCPRW